MGLESSFEDDLQEAILDDVESKMAGQQGNIVFQFIEQAHANLRAYGSRHDYDVEPVIDSLGLVDVQRDQNGVTIRLGWEHEAAPYFEMGTSDHTINGNPVLSFVWSTDDAPQWVREQFEQARDTRGRFESGFRVFLSEVSVSGIPESRFIRDALEWLRRELQ